MGEKLPFRLILASASPARRYLLSRAGCTFDVMPSNIEEPNDAGFTDPRTLVQHIAWLKAAAVARQITETSPTVVLAADTVGWLNGQVLGKPADEADARRILDTLGGTTHELWTGVCLWLRPRNLQVAFQEMSQVAMTRLTGADLDAYIASGAWHGASGAYAIQEDGRDPLVRVVQGSVSNVIGLPMETLEEVLEQVKRSPWWLSGS